MVKATTAKERETRGDQIAGLPVLPQLSQRMQGSGVTRYRREARATKLPEHLEKIQGKNLQDTESYLPALLTAVHQSLEGLAVPSSFARHGHLLWSMQSFRKVAFNKEAKSIIGEAKENNRSLNISEIKKISSELSAPVYHQQLLLTLLNKGASVADFLNITARIDEKDYLPFLALSPRQLNVMMTLLLDLDKELKQYQQQLEAKFTTQLAGKELDPSYQLLSDYLVFIKTLHGKIEQQHEIVANIAFRILEIDYRSSAMGDVDILNAYLQDNRVQGLSLEERYQYRNLSVKERLRFSAYIAEHRPEKKEALDRLVLALNMRQPDQVVEALHVEADNKEKQLFNKVTEALYDSDRAQRIMELDRHLESHLVHNQLATYTARLAVLEGEQAWLADLHKELGGLGRHDLDVYEGLLDEHRQKTEVAVQQTVERLLDSQETTRRELAHVRRLSEENENNKFLSACLPDEFSLTQQLDGRLLMMDEEFEKNWQARFFSDAEQWLSGGQINADIADDFSDYTTKYLSGKKLSAARVLQGFLKGEKVPLPDTNDELMFYKRIEPLFSNIDEATQFIQAKAKPVLLASYHPANLRVHVWLHHHAKSQLEARLADNAKTNVAYLGAAKTFYQHAFEPKNNRPTSPTIRLNDEVFNTGEVLGSASRLREFAVVMAWDESQHRQSEREMSDERVTALKALFDDPGLFQREDKLNALIELANAFQATGDHSAWETIKVAVSNRLLSPENFNALTVLEWENIEHMAKACNEAGDDTLLARVAYQHVMPLLPTRPTVAEWQEAIADLLEVEKVYEKQQSALKTHLSLGETLKDEDYLKLQVLLEKRAILWRQIEAVDSAALSAYLSTQNANDLVGEKAEVVANLELIESEIVKNAPKISAPKEVIQQLADLLKNPNFSDEDKREIQQQLDSLRDNKIEAVVNEQAELAESQANLAELRTDQLTALSRLDLAQMQRYHDLLQAKQKQRSSLALGPVSLNIEVDSPLGVQLQKQCAASVGEVEVCPPPDNRLNIMARFADQSTKENYLLAILRGLLDEQVVSAHVGNFWEVVSQLGLLNDQTEKPIFQLEDSQEALMSLLEQHFSSSWTPALDTILSQCLHGMSYANRQLLTNMRHQALLKILVGDAADSDWFAFFNRMHEDGNYRYFLQDGGEEHLAKYIQLEGYYWQPAVHLLLDKVGLYGLQADHAFIFMRDALQGKLPDLQSASFSGILRDYKKSEDEAPARTFLTLLKSMPSVLFDHQYKQLAQLLLELQGSMLADLSTLDEYQFLALTTCFEAANIYDLGEGDKNNFYQLKARFLEEAGHRQWCDQWGALFPEKYSAFFHELLTLNQNFKVTTFAQRKWHVLLNTLDEHIDQLVELAPAQADKAVSVFNQFFSQLDISEAFVARGNRLIYSSVVSRLQTYKEFEPEYQIAQVKAAAYASKDSVDPLGFRLSASSDLSWHDLAQRFSAYLSVARKQGLCASLEAVRSQLNAYHPTSKMLAAFMNVLNRSPNELESTAAVPSTANEDYLMAYPFIYELSDLTASGKMPNPNDKQLGVAKADQLMVDWLFTMHLAPRFADRGSFESEWEKIPEAIKNWSVFKETLLHFLLTESRAFWAGEVNLQGEAAERLLKIMFCLLPHLDPAHKQQFTKEFAAKVEQYVDQAYPLYEGTWASGKLHDLIVVQRQLALFGSFGSDNAVLIPQLARIAEDGFLRLSASLTGELDHINVEDPASPFHGARIAFLMKVVALLNHYEAEPKDQLNKLREDGVQELAKNIDAYLIRISDSADKLQVMLPALVDLRQRLAEVGFIVTPEDGHDPIETKIMDRINELCSQHAKAYVASQTSYKNFADWLQATRAAFSLNTMFTDQSAVLSDDVRAKAATAVTPSLLQHRGDLNESAVRAMMLTAAIGYVQTYLSEQRYDNAVISTVNIEEPKGVAFESATLLHEAIELIRQNKPAGQLGLQFEEKIAAEMDRHREYVSKTLLHDGTDKSADAITLSSLTASAQWLRSHMPAEFQQGLKVQLQHALRPYYLLEMIGAVNTGVLFGVSSDYYAGPDVMEQYALALLPHDALHPIAELREKRLGFQQAQADSTKLHDASFTARSNKQEAADNSRVAKQAWQTALYSQILDEPVVDLKAARVGVVNKLFDANRDHENLSKVFAKLLSPLQALLQNNSDKEVVDIAQLAKQSLLGAEMKGGAMTFVNTSRLSEKLNSMFGSGHSETKAMAHIAALIHWTKANCLQLDALGRLNQLNRDDVLQKKSQLVQCVSVRCTELVSPFVKKEFFIKSDTDFKAFVSSRAGEMQEGWLKQHAKELGVEINSQRPLAHVTSAFGAVRF